MMKIIFLHTDFRVYWLPRLKFLGRFLRDHGHSLHVVEIAGKGSPYAFSAARSTGMEYWECLFPARGMEEISPAQARKKVMEHLESLRPDIVFAGAIAYPSGSTAVKFCRDHRLPLVIFDNARLNDVPRSFLTNLIKRIIYSNVDAMLIPAPSHREDYSFWGIDEAKLYFGLNVVDNEYWAELAKNQAHCKDLPESFLLGVGRQVPKKNWLNLLSAYRKSNVSLPLVLVGNGSDHTALLEYIGRYQLKKQVFLCDFLEPEKLAVMYSRAKALILPSHYGETWGLTVNEAMACGTPVLVSRRCGCCETLCLDGVTGFSFEPEEEDMIRVLREFDRLDEASRQQMSENARKKVREWGVERFASSVLQAAEDLTRKKSNGYRNLSSRVIISLWKGRYRPV